MLPVLGHVLMLKEGGMLKQSTSKIITVTVPNERKELLEQFLDIETLTIEEQKRKHEVISYA